MTYQITACLIVTKPISFTGVSSTPSFQIIGDNVDLEQNPTHHSLGRKKKEHHWFQNMAVLNRISGNHLPNTQPVADISTLPLHTFLPSVADCVSLHRELAILVSRVLVKKLTAFQFLQPGVEHHIAHEYSAIMSKKSNIVSTYLYCHTRLHATWHTYIHVLVHHTSSLYILRFLLVFS